MKISWKAASVHLLLILSFLSIPIFSSPDFDYSFRLFRVIPFLENFIGYLCIIGCFYLHHYLLLPRFYAEKKMAIYILATVILFAAIVMIESLIFRIFDPISERPMGPAMPGKPGLGPPFMLPYLDLLIPFILVMLFSHNLFINRRAKQIELDKYRAELQNLKYQLQPHFLFNSLNNIYAISIIDSARTPEYILKLSEILRFLLATENMETVSLKDDIAFCQRYIDLQALRFGGITSDWDIHLEESPHEYQIPPFLLIPIIENVFKYGIHPDKHSPIHIKLQVHNGELTLLTRNKKNNSAANNLLVSQKLGLTNTRARLQLIFPSSHNLHIDENDDEYVLRLQLQLKQ